MNPAPGFMEAFTHVIKTFDFNGRARRAEYWKFAIIYGVIASILSGVASGLAANPDLSTVGIVFYIIYGVFCLALLVQSIAVCVRRLHDIGKSGFAIFISLIPFVGSIILLVWTCTDSERGENQYGPSPKYQSLEKI